MRIAYLGAGTWGVCLAALLADKGYEVILWTSREEFASELNSKKAHPKLPGFQIPTSLVITSDLEVALNRADLIVESVTSQGIRPVFERIKSLKERRKCPILLTSKGIEQNSCLLLSEVIVDVLGEESRPLIGCLSGPSHAEEVIAHLPTSVVCSAYDPVLMPQIVNWFTTPYFRVYPNSDIAGVSFGGAMKNIVAIACGISDGLGFGDNTKAALITRGLHEICKLSRSKGCRVETLSGLAGLGDLCVTCLSTLSRNYRFGRLIAEGRTPSQAREEIGMVVEGIYTVVSARQLSSETKVPLPIADAIYAIVYEHLNPKDAVKSLLQRAIKEEHL